jgi:hypothetical protein
VTASDGAELLQPMEAPLVAAAPQLYRVLERATIRVGAAVGSGKLGVLEVRRPLRPFRRPFVLAEIHLCNGWSGQEILRRDGRG